MRQRMKCHSVLTSNLINFPYLIALRRSVAVDMSPSVIMTAIRRARISARYMLCSAHSKETTHSVWLEKTQLMQQQQQYVTR